MKEIPLSQGKVALVDDEDFDWLNQWNWSCCSRYAARNISQDGKQKLVQMHRTIMGLGEYTGIQVDHIDMNTLNNQRSNLRICTPLQNSLHKSKSKRNTSGYKGVDWFEPAGLWRARASLGKIRKAVYCKSLLDAADAYDKMCEELHGEFAVLNNAKRL